MSWNFYIDIFTEKIDFPDFYEIIKFMRTIQKIKCKLCDKEFSSAGFGNHLKQTHNMDVEKYVEKYGEYRINKIKADKILKKSETKFKCLLDDDDKLYTERALTFRLRKTHRISKDEYIIKHLLNGNQPTCKCGCGQPTKILSYNPPYCREYISGHNSISDNPMKKGHSEKSKQKMKNSAIKRIEKIKGVLPYHSKKSIKKRAKKYSNTMLQRRIENNNVKLLSTNSELDQKIFKFQCKKCNHVQVDNGFSFFLCEKCFPKVRSRYEKEFKEFFEKFDIEYENNVRKIVDNRFELDFYFPKQNLAMEFNGLYYHGEVSNNKDKTYHIKKTEFCNSLGIDLIHVFEDEWINKKEIIKSKLLYKLNQTKIKKVYARNCVIKEVTSKESNNFLEKNHIQGKDKSSIRIGLYYNDELVSIMTFSKLSISKGQKSEENTYELSRFCSKIFYSVVGGYTKLFSYFEKNYKFDKIITYADRRWSSSNNVYSTVNWEFVGITPPNYWYMDKQHTMRKHRFNFTKHKIINKMNGDPKLTEWENMKQMGFDRIWDCGHFKYEYKNNIIELDQETQSTT